MSEKNKMPLLEHIKELRDRLIKSVVAILILFFVFFSVKEHIYGFLVQPLANVLVESGENRRMIFTALHEAFFTYIKVSFWTALFVGFPFVALQFWRFVATGLYLKEKRALLPYLVISPILFFLGGALVYYFIFPLAWKFFISFEAQGTASSLAVQLEPKVNEYLSLVMRLIFAFGLSFQLPVVLTLLARAGLTSSKGLARKRKYAIVFSFIGAAIITPPDVISQVGLAIPIIILYEISIFAVRIVEKKRQKEDATAEEELSNDKDLHTT